MLTGFCSERERPFFVPSPGIRFAERAEGCASVSKVDPTPSAYQRLDFPMRIPVSGGLPVGADGDPTMMLIFVNSSEC